MLRLLSENSCEETNVPLACYTIICSGSGYICLLCFKQSQGFWMQFLSYKYTNTIIIIKTRRRAQLMLQEKPLVKINKMFTKILFHALLFALFVPGVLVTLPPGGSKWVVVATHSVLFALLSSFVWRALFARK